MPVTNIAQSQTVDVAGNVIDVLEITFTVADKPGSFTVTVPLAGDYVAAANTALTNMAQAIGSIYTVQI